MKKVIRIVLAVLLCIVLACAAAFAVFYASRLRTLASVEQLSAYEDGYNLYRMNVCYDYSIERMIARGIDDDQAMIDTVLKEALPLLPVKLKAPAFGCTAFTVRDTESGVHMGRNYDFKNDTSAMLVYCAPKDGYRSVAFAALDNVSANTPEQSRKQKIAALTAPFICLDGMNEKGVSIAVLTLDSAPTHQKNGKPTIFTTLAIRLVLDRAASTAEAVALLGEYDMLATSGRDYHFYITDAAGDGRVIEYDCESEARTLVATPSEAVTNFFILYKDRVLPNQKNGIYGHGKERYDAVLDVLAEQPRPSSETVWAALRASSQEPNPKDITSNTQWSIHFFNTNGTLEVTLRRHWQDRFVYSLSENTVTRAE